MSPLDELLKQASDAELRTAPLPKLSLEPLGARRILSRSTRIFLSSALAAGAFALSSPGALETLGTGPFVGLFLALGASSSIALGAATPGESKRIAPILRGVVPALLFAGVVGVLLGVARYYSWLEFVAHEPHAQCLPHSLLSAALVTTALFAVWRRTDPFSPRALGAYFGALGGVIGALSVTLSCPSQEGLHLLFGHGLATLAFATVGSLLGQRVLSP